MIKFEIRDRQGRLIESDKDTLQDGQRMRVPLQFRDGRRR
jgi:hypothetical protein